MDVLRATLPAGTVSGAPKVRAMEIIDELEPARRGPYAGVVGYIDFSGNVDTAIAIRTMLVGADGQASVEAGAGIVADSLAETEDLECRNKAAALLAAVPGARRIAAARAEGATGVAQGEEAWRRRAPGGIPVTADQGDGGYEALRRGLAATEIARDVVRVSGPDAERYLQGQLSQDIARLAPGEWAWALVLQPQGKLDAFVRVLADRPGRVPPGHRRRDGATVVARLLRFRLRTKVDIEPLAWRAVAVRGPGAVAARRRRRRQRR